MLTCFYGQAQIFEGSMTYKTEVSYLDHLKDSIDIHVQNDLKELNSGIGITYYKEGNYASEIIKETGKKIYVFNPENNLFYEWIEGEEEAATHNFEENFEPAEKVTELASTQIILGIECHGLELKSKNLSTTYWYNKDYFKMDPSVFQQNDYTKRIGCIPLKVETKTESILSVHTVTSFKEMDISDEKFEIPSFTEINSY